MAIVLYPHNESAYHAALTMLRETGKAAVIHPTGTGKSFVGFKLCENFPEKRICWLSPSECIFRTQLENLAMESGVVPENITFLTYARLMMMDADEIAALRPDFIILDEFHRCGAEQWGQGTQTLISTYPDTPLLGLSATNIRFLDNQRDMAKELFDGYIASEISLGEAIAREILKPPKYVLSVYSFQKDLEKYEDRVKKLCSPTLRARAEELLKTLRRRLEDADGLDVVFARHMPDPHGKYIVFCSNVTHMERMIELVPDWFSRLDSEPHVYRAYSPDPKTCEAFTAFREDGSDHLKLLFTISWDDMYGYAKAYYGKMGHLLIPMTYKDGHSLGRWPEYFAAAENYARTYGHLNVLYAYITSDGVKLGKWFGFLKAKRKQHGEGWYLRSCIHKCTEQ